MQSVNLVKGDTAEKQPWLYHGNKAGLITSPITEGPSFLHHCLPASMPNSSYLRLPSSIRSIETAMYDTISGKEHREHLKDMKKHKHNG